VATPEDVEATLVTPFPKSKTRRAIFEGLLAFRNIVHNIVPVQRELIDGSFVTDKLDPNDVDLSMWISADDLEALELVDRITIRSMFLGDRDTIKQMYRCDPYLVPECPAGHPSFNAFQKMLWTDDYWQNARDKDGGILAGVRKGYVRIT
jgi:hypothetical protein